MRGQTAGGASKGNVLFGVLASAFLFGAGHIPFAVAATGGFTLHMVSYIVLANFAVGVLYGTLYVRMGIASAIVAHAVTHIGLFVITLVL